MEEDIQSTLETLHDAEENGERKTEWEEWQNERREKSSENWRFVLYKPMVSHTHRLNL